MTLPADLPANSATGSEFTAAQEDAVETAINEDTAAIASILNAEGNTYSIFDFGGKVDGKRREDATISASSLSIVSCHSYHFTASDVGKTIVVGGGASSTAHQALITTIASLSGNNAVLTTPATNAIASAFIAWGTDDGAAWTAALTALIDGTSPCGQLTMPAGISICGQSISLAPAGYNVELFSLRGASVGTSRIICTAAGGFLTLDLTSSYAGGHTAQIDFADLNISTTVAAAPHALSVTVLPGGEQLQRAYSAKNLLISGFDNVSGYWDKPIEVLGLYRPILTDIFVVGLWPSTDLSDTSILFLPTLGINLNQCYNPDLSHVNVWSHHRALQMIETQSPGVEGAFLDTCCFVNNREGVYWTTPGVEPQITIHDGHYNNRDFNICLNGKKFGVISHGLSYQTPYEWAPGSTLATAVNTATTPTTLTLASTSGFPEIGAVQIGSEWFTYNNLTTGAPGAGMDGVTLQNVVRAQFGTVDPGTNYAVGSAVAPATADILLLNCYSVRVDNEQFEFYASTNRMNVMLHSGNTSCAVVDSRHDTECIAVAVGKDTTGTDLLHNSHASTMTQVLDGATDTVYKSHRARSCRLVKTAIQSIATGTLTSISWDSKDWDTEGFWSSGSTITIPKNKGIKRVRLTANAVFTANATGSRMIEFAYNGAHAQSGMAFRAQPGADTSFSTGIGNVCELIVKGGDTIAVQVDQDSGSTLSIGAGGVPADTFVICEVVEGA